MKQYTVRELTDRGVPIELLFQTGVVKAFEIRHKVVKLKHEVKEALKSGVKTIDTERLNERLQHIAKVPRPGLPKLRCWGKCRCELGIVEVKNGRAK
jgi:hypothetical protein